MRKIVSLTGLLLLVGSLTFSGYFEIASSDVGQNVANHRTEIDDQDPNESAIDSQKDAVSLPPCQDGIAEIAKQGCCSHHGGVCGCSNGRVICCDGTKSPSCKCSN